MTEQQKRAAYLVADNKLTALEIAKEVGVSVRTVFNWKGNEDFDTEVRKIANEWRIRARGKGVADQDYRLRDLNDRHKRLRAVIQARAKDPAMKDVPGGRTGLLTVTYRMLSRIDTVGEGKHQREVKVSEPVPEYAIDTGLLAEMRMIEQHAAVEMGQWKSRSVVENTRTIDATPAALKLAQLFAGFSPEQLDQVQARLLAIEQGEAQE